MIAMVRDFIRFEDDSEEKPVLSAEAQARIQQNGLLGKFKGGLRVSQVRESELLNVSFSSPDAALAARIVNATLDEFINMQMDSRLELSKMRVNFWL